MDEMLLLFGQLDKCLNTLLDNLLSEGIFNKSKLSFEIFDLNQGTNNSLW